jgi:outer membrane protein assembly factor BamB
MKSLLYPLLFALLVAVARADRDLGPPTARVIARHDGAYFLLVVTTSERFQDSLWTVYSVAPKGIFKELWSSDGINGRDMYLASDGIHVVCVESWPGGRMTSNDIIIAVYEYGKLLRAYRTTDVVKDTARIERSVSHYRWLADGAFINSNGGMLFFTTIDDKDYTLDMVTGELRWKVK